MLAANWPDFVFDDGYELLSIEQLRSFIKTNKHLPGIPSQTCVESEGGIKIGDLSIDLVKKIEELTLYIIELKQQNDELFSSIEKLGNNK